MIHQSANGASRRTEQFTERAAVVVLLYLFVLATLAQPAGRAAAAATARVAVDVHLSGGEPAPGQQQIGQSPSRGPWQLTARSPFSWNTFLPRPAIELGAVDGLAAWQPTAALLALRCCSHVKPLHRVAECARRSMRTSGRHPPA